MNEWGKPEGCVCGGPSDPYHSWCYACEQQGKAEDVAAMEVRL